MQSSWRGGAAVASPECARRRPACVKSMCSPRKCGRGWAIELSVRIVKARHQRQPGLRLDAANLCAPSADRRACEQSLCRATRRRGRSQRSGVVLQHLQECVRLSEYLQRSHAGRHQFAGRPRLAEFRVDRPGASDERRQSRAGLLRQLSANASGAFGPRLAGGRTNRQRWTDVHGRQQDAGPARLRQPACSVLLKGPPWRPT